ncbi:hypothetical protein [uncultured Roseibium sp.]|uniref:hypothetical protein n=1 Tax=uncultured Roseibium sp. TaxID=1936171 RepID=UPI0026047AF1|nr:hypothetical protein [uncultured Roseibium sp.]
MPTRPLSNEVLQKTIDVYIASMRSWTDSAKKLGIARSTLEHRLKVAKRRGMLGPMPKALDGFEVKEYSEQIGKNGEVKSRSTKYSPEGGGQFEVPDGYKIKGESVLTDADGQIRARWVKTKEGEEDPLQVASVVRGAFEGFVAKSPNIWRLKDHDEDSLTVYPLADFHLGMFAWSKETEGPDWDLKIAERVLTETFQELVERAPKSRKAVILGLGDLMHADSHKNQTPGSGNIMDVDTRYQKVLPKLCDIIIQCTEFVRHKHAEVEAEFKAGNHDPASTVAIRTGLDLYYRNDKHMTVNTSPSPFWWHGFGVNMLCGTHGDGAKIKDLPGIMASYKREMWGSSKSCHAFTGHVHHELCTEKDGTRVYSLRAPIPSDAWHSAEGYLSGRSMYGFHFHKDKGSTGRSEVEIL